VWTRAAVKSTEGGQAASLRRAAYDLDAEEAVGVGGHADPVDELASADIVEGLYNPDAK
jgi:hypothetical protein